MSSHAKDNVGRQDDNRVSGTDVTRAATSPPAPHDVAGQGPHVFAGFIRFSRFWLTFRGACTLSAGCFGCGGWSERVHGSCLRLPADVRSAGWATWLVARLRTRAIMLFADGARRGGWPAYG